MRPASIGPCAIIVGVDFHRRVGRWVLGASHLRTAVAARVLSTCIFAFIVRFPVRRKLRCLAQQQQAMCRNPVVALNLR
jgi:hypothetical protein